MKPTRRIAIVRCDDARRLVHEQLDGALDDDAFRQLTRHLVRCADCRAHQRELRGAVAKLRQLPVRKLDDETLERVWDRTIRRTPRAAASRRRAAVVWMLPAAATLLLAAVGALALWSRAHTAAETTRAEAELRLAVDVAGKALRRGRAATVDAVLRSDLVPALDRIPVLSLLAKQIPERRT
jgi:anti-sigma factor RsiW